MQTCQMSLPLHNNYDLFINNLWGRFVLQKSEYDECKTLGQEHQAVLVMKFDLVHWIALLFNYGFSNVL